MERDDEGYYIYYAGGFATRLEADEAQLFLKEKGFKSPEICRWQDDTMENLTAVAEDDDSTDDAPLVGMHYMIKIATDVLSEELNALLKTEAPNKRISKINNSFTVGTFDNRDEAELLMTLLSDSCDAPMELVEIELNE